MFFDFLSTFFQWILSLGDMPQVQWVYDYAIPYINFALYFVPVSTIIKLLILYLAINVFSYVVRLIITLWELIPLV